MPTPRISFLGMELDSVNQTARLTQERAQSVLNCFKTLSGRTAVPLKLFQRLLGHMAAAAATYLLGLLHMRLLQRWLHGQIPRWAWKRGTHRVHITPACCKTFSPWSDPSFLQAVVPLEHVSRHAVVFTDVSGFWTPCLEPPQRARSAQGRSGLYGQHGDYCVYQLARRFTLPSHVATRLPPPPLESEASEVPSCHPHPRSVQLGSQRAVLSSTSR